MTNRSDLLAARAHKAMMAAQELMDAGFCTKAAQSRALGELNRAYNETRDIVHGLSIDAARAEMGDAWQAEATWPDYIAKLDRYDMPFDLHQVRPAHIEAIRDLAPGSAQIIAELVDLRLLAKATPVTPIIKDSTRERVAAVRRDIIEQMERHKAQYVEALDMARLFNGLPVSVNAHWVHHEQGTVYLRHYFYLRGKLTPLQVLLAAGDTYAREQEA